KVRIVERRPDYGRAEIVEILEPGPARRPDPVPGLSPSPTRAPPPPDAPPLQHLRPPAPGRPHSGAAQGRSGEGDSRAHRQGGDAVRSRADHRRALALPPA